MRAWENQRTIRSIINASVQTNAPGMTKREAANGLLICVMLAIAFLVLLRLALTGVIELLPEEAYYWMYAKHPALGYFDHPPMVAWIIALGTTLFGDTQLGVRFGTFLLWIASCGLVFLTGRLWFGRRAALAAILLFALIPVYVGAGLIVTPDAPLLFFWLATLYFISRALQTNRGNYWLLAGVAFGGALLSKYYALLLAPSVVLFLVFSPAQRRWLRRPQFWLALPIALLVFSPVIIWNAQHDWASFLFQSTRTAATQKHMLRDALRFWLVQVAMLGPVFFPVFVCAAARGIKRGWRQPDDRWNFVASFSLPLFFLFAAASFKTEVHVNWTAPAFLSLAFGAGTIVVDGLYSANKVRAKRWRIGSGIAVALSVVAIILGHTSLAWGFPKVFAYTRAGGWRGLAQDVESARADLSRETHQQPFVIGVDKYNFAAELGYYLRQPDECVNTYALGARGLGFRYWTNLREFEGRPAIAVLNKPGSLAELRRHFDRVDEPTQISLQSHGVRPRRAYLVQCRGYHEEERLAKKALP
jgi:dolichol-phosphate mannosyltransferase